MDTFTNKQSKKEKNCLDTNKQWLLPQQVYKYQKNIEVLESRDIKKKNHSQAFKTLVKAFLVFNKISINHFVYLES